MPVKRKVKTSKPVKRKVKSSKSVKRKVKKDKPVKRKVKKDKPVKRTFKHNNLVIKKGYCEATILDENEPDDPCDIHKSENECLGETKDTEYWRSYDCKWKK
jgi:hypothetical protein